MVSAAPLTWVVMAPTGLHGVHHVTVAAASAAAAKQLLAKLMQGAVKPGICAAYSEEVELDQEVRDLASGKSAEAGVNASQAVYIPNIDEKYLAGQGPRGAGNGQAVGGGAGTVRHPLSRGQELPQGHGELDGARRLRAGDRQVRGGTGVGTIDAAQPETVAAGRQSR